VLGLKLVEFFLWRNSKKNRKAIFFGMEAAVLNVNDIMPEKAKGVSI